MKKFFVALFSAAMMLCAVLGLVACGNSVTVKLEAETLTMKVGDERTLAVTVEGSDKEAVLTSSNEAVVSVTGGGNLLQAKAEGSAVITAAVGSKSATCTVTVEKDDKVAIVQLNYSEAELLKNGSQTLQATLKYDGAVVNGVQFNWAENSNGAIVSLQPSGDRATVTGVAFGEATVTVSAVYRYRTVEATATVRVKKDIAVTPTNLDKTNGVYRLNLTNNPAMMQGGISSFTPEAEVTEEGVPVPGATVALRLKAGTAQGVVSVESGVITALKAGEAAVELVYDNDGTEAVQEILVTVTVPSVSAKETLDLEKSASSAAIAVTGVGEVESVTLGETALSFTQEGETVTVTGYGEADFGQYKLTVRAANLVYTVNAEVCTKAIHSADDWNAVLGTMELDGNGFGTLGGYYVLAEDIDFAGKTIAKYCVPTWGGTQGFTGTFDGRGHLVKNLTVTKDGESFFGLLASTATVKNLGFVNFAVEAGATRTGAVASFVYGNVENVFVKGEVRAENCGGIAQYMFAGSVKNCFVYLTNTKDNLFALLSQSFDNMDISDCYSVGGTALYRNGGDSPVVAPEAATLKNFASFAAAKAAGLDLASFDSAIWDTEGGVPVFKGYKECVSTGGAIRNNEEIKVSGSMEILGSSEFVYTLKDAPAGITLEDGVVTIEGNFGATFTVVATHALYADISVEKTFTVGDLPKENLNVTADFDVTAHSAEITVQGIGTVTAAQIGDGAATFTQNGEKITLTFNGGTVGTTAAATVVTAEKQYQFNVLFVTKIIRSTDDWAAVADTITNNSLNGYYVLANDLDYAGKAMAKFCTPTWGGTQGFAGTFDGRGYTIKNLTIKEDGVVGEGGHSFFGLTAASAIIKNVGFMNATIEASANFRAAVVAGFHYGTIENVFVQVTNNSAHAGGIAQSVWTGATIRNCVVEQQNERADGYALCWTSFDGCTIENCYSIGAGALYRNGGDSAAVAPETDTLKNFATVADMKAANVDLSGWDTSVWDISQGYPVFKTLKNA